MRDQHLVIRADAVLTPEGFAPLTVHVHNGVITHLGPRDAPLSEAPTGTAPTGSTREIILPPGHVLLPGIVDTHVHVNEPGRTEWEGFASATAAAAAGGVTTLIDMPLNSIPPTVTVAALELKRAAAQPQATVNVGFWGGVIPGTLGTLRSLHDAGVFGFKAFLSDSGVDEFPALSTAQLHAAGAEIAEFDGLLLVHAEDPAVLLAAPHVSGPRYQDFVAGRPDAAEHAAIATVIDVVQRTGVRAHILHLSSAAALPQLREAKACGLPITVETCPHYLSFTAEEIADGLTAFTCCPPIRSRANQHLLWQGLEDGVIDFIASDHSPATLDLKLGHGGDFARAWGGISGLQVSLPAVWTRARERGIGLDQVVEWMSGATARFAGLPTKGRIQVGADADLVAFAPHDTFRVQATELLHRNPVTAFDGVLLTGVVHATWVAGRSVFESTGIHSPRSGVPRSGALLTR